VRVKCKQVIRRFHGKNKKWLTADKRRCSQIKEAGIADGFIVFHWKSADICVYLRLKNPVFS
jgi:hypothetical protein